MNDEYNYIEFEIWLNERSIQGYMAEEEADDEAPLCWYDSQGFETNSLQNTRVYNELPDDEWDMIVEWLTSHDLVQDLIDYKDKKGHLMFREETDWGRLVTIDLYINCSKKDMEE